MLVHRPQAAARPAGPSREWRSRLSALSAELHTTQVQFTQRMQELSSELALLAAEAGEESAEE